MDGSAKKKGDWQGIVTADHCRLWSNKERISRTIVSLRTIGIYKIR